MSARYRPFGIRLSERSARWMTASSSSTPRPSAWASRNVDSVGSGSPSSSLKRASASAPTTRRLSRSTIGCSATPSPSPSISRPILAARLAAVAAQVGELVLARGALALLVEAAAELVLQVAQPVGDGDEAEHEAHGRHGELAGAERQARPPGALVRL